MVDPFSDDYDQAPPPPPKNKRVEATPAQIGAATKRRRTWEATPEGQARTRDINDLVTEHHNNLLRERGMPEIGRTQMKKAQIYEAMGVHNEGHGRGEQQLPGFENPHTAPEPPRWEEGSEKNKAKVEHRLRAQGTSLEQMKNDFGAQFDQSIWRAHMAGHRRASTGEPVAFTQHFYGHHPEDSPEPLDRPREMLGESRRNLASQGISVDPTVHVGTVGHVSPNTKFTIGERGARQSPNIDTAHSIIEQYHGQGRSPEEVDMGTNPQGVRNQGRPANAIRAALMLEHVAEGGSMGTARNRSSKSQPLGSTQWGPKTGPFANSFDAQHPDFFVADVHSGGGGMLPHQGTYKPWRQNANGSMARTEEFRDDPRSDKELMEQENPVKTFYRDKSEREKSIETSGVGKSLPFHSAADFAARQAVQERGLGSSVRIPQAAQWGEEQIQRGIVSHEEAYPHLSVNPSRASQASAMGDAATLAAVKKRHQTAKGNPNLQQGQFF